MILKKKTLNALIICAFASALLGTAEVSALAPNPGYWEGAKCQFSIPEDKSCGKCKHGSEPTGSGTLYCEGNDGGAVDFGLSMEITSLAVYGSQKTNVFFQDDAKADTITKIGKGYIGATVNYNHISTFDGSIIWSYILCDAIEIDDYDDWLAVCEFLYDAKIPNDLVIVYPNPTSGEASIKLKDEYSSFVKTASYRLISPSGSFLTTLVPNHPADVIQIPSMHLTTMGAYTIICNIEYMDANNTLKQTSFSVSLMVN